MKILAALFAVFIVAIVILADADKLPVFIHAIYDFPNGDKVGHFILFGILNFLLTRATLASSHPRTSKRVALTTGLILALLIALEEFSQRFFPSRTSDWRDLLASCAGIALGGWLAYKTLVAQRGRATSE